jgi:hypothetical protein
MGMARMVFFANNANPEGLMQYFILMLILFRAGHN